MENRRILTVEIRQRLEKLVRPPQDVVWPEGTPALDELLFEALPWNEFHDEILLAVAVDEMLDDVRDRRMVEPAQQARLSVERPANRLVLTPHVFDGDCTVVALVRCLVDGAPAAPPH